MACLKHWATFVVEIGLYHTMDFGLFFCTSMTEERKKSYVLGGGERVVLVGGWRVSRAF